MLRPKRWPRRKSVSTALVLRKSSGIVFVTLSTLSRTFVDSRPVMSPKLGMVVRD